MADMKDQPNQDLQGEAAVDDGGIEGSLNLEFL